MATTWEREWEELHQQLFQMFNLMALMPTLMLPDCKNFLLRAADLTLIKQSGLRVKSFLLH